MKIYRHKANPKNVGVKFDGMRKTMVQIEATGSLETAVKLTFTTRDGDDDFNADVLYEKDYNATLEGIMTELLGIDANSDLRYKKFLVNYLPTQDVEVSLVEEESSGVGIGNYATTIDRLVYRLSNIC